MKHVLLSLVLVSGLSLLSADFTATAVFEAKDGGWEYSFGWTGMDAWKFYVETVSFPDLVVPRTDKSGVLYSRAHGMGMICRPDWPKWGWEREPFVQEACDDPHAVLLGIPPAVEVELAGDDGIDGDVVADLLSPENAKGDSPKGKSHVLSWREVSDTSRQFKRQGRHAVGRVAARRSDRYGATPQQ